MNGSIVISKLTTFASTSSLLVKRRLAPLWKIFTFSLASDTIYPAKTVVATLGKGSFTVVLGTRFLSRMKIKGVREYSFEEERYPQPEVLASSLSLAVNELGASNVDVCLSIPKAWAVIKISEFPIAVKENLSNVVSYELDRITPFSSENAFFDFKILSENENTITLSVIAAKADVILPYIDALSETGITVNRIAVDLSGIETLLQYIDKKPDSVFIEVHEDRYEAAHFSNHAIMTAFSQYFNTDDEKSKFDSIVSGISPLLDTPAKGEKTPQIVALLKDKNPVLKEFLKSNIGMPVRFLNEMDITFKLPEEGKGIPYAAIGGVLEALWPKSDGMNLLSKGLHKKPSTPKALTIFLLLAIIIMWVLYLLSPLRIEEQRLQEIDRQIALRKEEVKAVEALKKEAETIQNDIDSISKFKTSSPLALNVLKEITTIVPKNAWLTRVRISEKVVNLEGYASSATGLLPKLEASPYFEKVEFSSPTFRDTRMNADRFTIKMALEGIQQEETPSTQKEGEEEEVEEE